MKTRKSLLFSLSIYLIVFMGLQPAYGQLIDKTYRWNYKVNPDSWVIMSNYDTDMQINTWDKPEVEFHMIVEIEFRDRDDASRVDSYIRDLDFESTRDRTVLKSSFWKSRSNIMGVSTMVLEGLKTVRYKKFKMECILWIPEGASLELKTRYSEINMTDIGGELKLDSYDDEIYAGAVKGESLITARYSDMTFFAMKNIEADIYDCKLLTGNTGDINIITKYSEVKTGITGILDIDSYDDELDFEACSDIKYNAKYSELITGHAGKLVADNYECEFTAEKVREARIDSKYSRFDIKTAAMIDITSFYEDKLSLEQVGALNVAETKYGEFEIGELERACTVKSAYEDDFSFDRLGAGIEKFHIDGKYLDIELGLASDFDCRLKATIKYPELDFDEDIFKTKTHIKDDSDLEYEGIKGTEKTGMPELIISGYEVKLIIKEF